MTRIKYILVAFVCLLMMNCTTIEHEFPLEKRYWDIVDYQDVIRELRFGYQQEEKLPTFKDPTNKIIVEKLTDQQNFNIVLTDSELGLNYKNDIATKFFNIWKDMTKIYKATNRKDEYLYDQEMLAVWHFGLGLQLRYFELGNEQIKMNADDPNVSSVTNSIHTNVNTLIANYLFYLDAVNEEKSYTKEGKAVFAKGIDTYFSELMELYPEGNYKNMEKKATLMLKKSKSVRIKKSLKELIARIQLLKKEIKNN